MTKRFLIGILLVLLSFTSACSLLESELTIAIRNLEQAQSYRSDMTLSNIPIYGTMTVTMLVNGKYQKASTPTGFGSSTDSYSFTEDDVHYQLGLYQDEYLAFVQEPSESDDSMPNSDFSQLNPDEFTKNEEGYYTSSKNYGIYIDLEIKVENKYITEMVFRTDLEGFGTVNVKMEFSGYNSTEFDFPEYRIPNAYEIAAYHLTEAGFSIDIGETKITLTKSSTTLEHVYGTNSFTFRRYYNIQVFYPETQGEMNVEEFDESSITVFFDYEAYQYLVMLYENLSLRPEN